MDGMNESEEGGRQRKDGRKDGKKERRKEGRKEERRLKE